VGVTLAPIRPILTIADICDLLRISDRQFHNLREQGFFEKHNLLHPFKPEIDSKPRYYGEPFARLFESRKRMRLLNEALADASEAV
jgi:hypothetical protein